jgi:hypothetical protein
MSTTTPTLTRTQTAALAELRRVGHLWPTSGGRYETSGTGHAPFSQRTVQALVDAGHAKWAVRSPNAPAVMPHIVPVDVPADDDLTANADDTTMSERPCDGCGDDVLSLSARDLCDGCEAATSTDVYTRHLIVALPNVSGEEADSVAELIDAEMLTDGFTSHGTVTHALGAAVLAGSLAPSVTARLSADRDSVTLYTDPVGNLAPDAARELAGALLTLANQIDGK